MPIAHRALRASLAVAAVLAAAPAAARATGSYPGETLTLTQSGPAALNAPSTFTAAGQDLDAPEYAGGFNLYVYAKQPAAGTTCAPAYADEQNNYIAALTISAEKLIEVGGWEGADTAPFSIPVHAAFTQPGPELLCAYSTWAGDTAASATLQVNVPAAAPASMRRPAVKRAGNRLTCDPGAWTGSPKLATAWLRDGRAVAHGAHLAIKHKDKRHSFACRVTATTAGGSATATSRGLRIH